MTDYFQVQKAYDDYQFTAIREAELEAMGAGGSESILPSLATAFERTAGYPIAEHPEFYDNTEY